MNRVLFFCRMSTDKWINKTWHKIDNKYHLAIKVNGIMQFVGMEDTMSIKINQTQNDKYYMFSLIH